MATLINLSDSQVLASFCSAAPGEPYWLFRVLRGDADPRTYRLPEFTCDWPAKVRWNDVEDREPLLSVARKRAIVF
jgi:hypothetical protein